jgi:outer membrane protein OmpA-like peptidoglycan-associated protein
MSRLRTTYVLGSLVILVACGKPVAFEGTTPLTVTASPPPPPTADKPPPRVEVRDNQIAITEKIQFEYDKARILEVSHGLLSEVAQVIKANPHIKKIQIEGHASSEGGARHNQKLSEQRARAVMDYLLAQGVSKQLLVHRGFGIEKPIADNATEQGREANRRVEFNIVEQDVTQRRVEIDDTGAEKVLEEQSHTSTPRTGAGG